MGHLLGTPSRIAGARTDRVNTNPQPLRTTWVDVDGVDLDQPDPEGIVAFAIDQPHVGERMRGAGLEINGWVIGRGMTVRGIRTSTPGCRGPVYPLDVQRPDVAADYPAHPEAGSSGFSAWAAIDPTIHTWRISVEAILANGNNTLLAEIRGRAAAVPSVADPGSRAITGPDFVIIGAQRGGTTSLHAYLAAHPHISTPATKELHFLTDRHERGRDWYLGQFPVRLPPGILTGEATPYALFHPLAARRLHEIAPEARPIALLRNPVDRAYSHYRHERDRGVETLDFAAALDAEEERLGGEEAKLAGDATYVSAAHKHSSYMARGDYAPQLRRWLEVFPREQILVVRSEDLYRRSTETLARIAEFLTIGPDVRIPFSAHNQTAGSPLDPETRRRLSRHFAPLNAKLADLLGWDPGWS